MVNCADCGEHPMHSRSLCMTCYQAASRGGFLGDYPTQSFLNHPEAHARWLFGLGDSGIELLSDVAIEFGYRLVRA